MRLMDIQFIYPRRRLIRRRLRVVKIDHSSLMWSADAVVTRNISPYSILMGVTAFNVGTVIMISGKIKLEYNK